MSKMQVQVAGNHAGLLKLLVRGLRPLLGLLVLRLLVKRLRRRPTGMQMTSMEDAMNEATAFPETTNTSQINNMLNIFLWFEECPTAEEVAAGASKLLDLKRFRSAAVGGAWQLQEGTQAAAHVTMHSAATEAAALSLLEEVSKMKELPRDKPLWSVEVARVASGKSIGLLRIHHTIADGVGLATQMVPRVCTNRNGEPVTLSIPSPPRSRGGFVAGVLWYLDALRSTGKVLSAAVKPSESDLPFMDPHRMDLTYSGRRTPVFFPTISLDYVKKIKDAAKCTVNDVIFAAWAGAMRTYSEKHGHSFDKSTVARSLLAVAVPRSFPDNHDPEDCLINKFAFVPVDLNLDSADPKELIKANKANLDLVKTTTIAPVSLAITNNISPLLPKFMQQQTARDIFSRHSLVFSNVQGPKEDICIFGKPVEKFHVVFYNVNTQLLAVSCADKIFLNVTADPDVVKGLENEYPQVFLDELDAFGRAFGVEGTSRYGA